MKKILLIGAGYVGLHLLERWHEPRVIATTTTPEKIEILENIPQVERAILPEKIGEALEECDGAVICVAPKNGAGYEETYLRTAREIQSLLRERKKPLYLLYISSTSVYGQQERCHIDESTPPAPTSPEGKILLQTEETLLACADEQIKVCVLRPGGIYGPNRDLETRARKLSGRELPGTGDQPTNHSHVDDIAEAIVFCFTNRLEGIYNIVADAHPTREELYKTLCDRQRLPPPSWNPGHPSMHGSNSSVSNAKIKEAGFRFSHPHLDR